MSETTSIRLNGELRDVPSGTSVAQLVAELGLRPEQVAVEVNRELVARARRDERVLGVGDEIELVTLVGGG